MTWLTEDQLAKSAAGEGCGMACDCDAHLYSMARWALRAREWVLNLSGSAHPIPCAATPCQHSGHLDSECPHCTCGLRELMMEAT